jgi:hypothetical protein
MTEARKLAALPAADIAGYSRLVGAGAVKQANPGLALFVPRDQHIEFLALSHLLLG